MKILTLILSSLSLVAYGSGNENGGGNPGIAPNNQTGSVEISQVSGNTASYNSVAEFDIKLLTQPTNDVVIPLSSSDESEGITEQSKLTFTPDNYNLKQTVIVRGRNTNIQNGIQNYKIITGEAQSYDSAYNGLNIADVDIKGIVLTLSKPALIDPLIANFETTLTPQVYYTGNNQLSFSLTQSPDSMVIDLSSGLITWTPQESNEGQNFDIIIRVTDGSLFANASFTLVVAQPQPVTTQVQGNVLTVNDPSTTLNGLSITKLSNQNTQSNQVGALAGNDINQLNLEKVSLASVPAIPSYITPLSDVFVVKNVFDSAVELRFPLNNLPSNVKSISLYAWTETSHYDKIWSSVYVKEGYEGTASNPVLVITLRGVGGMAFLGYTTRSNNSQQNSIQSFQKKKTIKVVPSQIQALNSHINCVEKTVLFGLLESDYVCTTDDLTVTIKGFSENIKWSNTPNKSPRLTAILIR